jgi:hypothetical protein
MVKIFRILKIFRTLKKKSYQIQHKSFQNRSKQKFLKKLFINHINMNLINCIKFLLISDIQIKIILFLLIDYYFEYHVIAILHLQVMLIGNYDDIEGHHCEQL